MWPRHFIADTAIADSMVQFQRKKENGIKVRAAQGDGRGNKGKQVHAVLWGMLNADGVSIVSRSPGGLNRKMTVIVAACAPFELTLSGVKAEIMCLQTKRRGSVQCNVTAAGQVRKQTA